MVVAWFVTGGAVTPYTLVDLGTHGGETSGAYALNNRGQVVGTAEASDGRWYAFLWEDSVMTNLGTLEDTPSTAWAVNESGQVIGTAYASGRQRAFIWENGVMSALCAFESWAAEINDRGQAVGTVYGAKHKATLWEGGETIDISGGTYSEARGINESGQVVGKADGRACLWEDGVRIDLGTLGGSSSVAFAINDSGQVVGTEYGTGWRHGFLWEDGVMTDFGAVNIVLDINNAGQVVGESGGHAFLWENGVMIDLNDMIPAGSGWVLRQAQGINDVGQIAGTGYLNGVTRAFLLTPVTATPVLKIESLPDDSIELSWNGTSGKTYDIYIGSRAEFPRVPPQWFVAATVAGNEGTMTWTDAGGPTWAHPATASVRQRFYQVIECCGEAALASSVRPEAGNVRGTGGNVTSPGNQRKAAGAARMR